MRWALHMGVYFGWVGVVNKVWVSLDYTPCTIGVELSDVSCCVQCWTKHVNLCAFCETVELWRLSSAHWSSRAPLWIGIIESSVVGIILWIVLYLHIIHVRKPPSPLSLSLTLLPSLPPSLPPSLTFAGSVYWILRYPYLVAPLLDNYSPKNQSIPCRQLPLSLVAGSHSWVSADALESFVEWGWCIDGGEPW